jgi:hypothetical protein
VQIKAVSSDELIVLLYCAGSDEHTKNERENLVLHSSVCYLLQYLVHLVLIHQRANIQPYFRVYPGNLDE